MGYPTKCGFKRLFRVVLSGCIAGGITSMVTELEGTTVYFFIAPALTGLISAIGKAIREKWGLELPI